MDLLNSKLLRFLTRTLSLDFDYFFRNHLFLSISTIINILSGLILSILYSHFLSKYTYGQYILIFSFISTLSVTRLSGLQSIFPYAISAGFEGFFPKVQKISFVSSLVGSIGLVAIAIYYMLPGKPPLATPLLLTALLFPFINSFYYYSSYLRSKDKFALASLYDIGQAIIPNLFIAIVVVFLPHIFWIMLAALLPQSLLNLGFTLKTLRMVKNMKTSSKDLKYGLKLSVVNLIPYVFQELDDLLLAKTQGFEKLAIYSFANLIPRQISPFVKNFETLAVPKIGGLKPDAILRDMPSKIMQYFLATTIIVLGYILIVPFVFRLLYPQYIESILPSQIYSISLIFYPWTLVFQSFHRLRLLKKTATFSTLSIAAKIVIFLVLIPLFGIIGAALATVLSEAFKLLLSIIMLKRTRISGRVLSDSYAV